MCAAAAATTDRVVIVVMGPTAAPSRLLLVVGSGGADPPSRAGGAASPPPLLVIDGGAVGTGWRRSKLPTTRSRTLPEVTPRSSNRHRHCRRCPMLRRGLATADRRATPPPALAAKSRPPLQPPSAHGHLPRPTHSAFGGVERRQEEQRED